MRTGATSTARDRGLVLDRFGDVDRLHRLAGGQVAELTRSASPALLGSSAYHSQQAAEKALKAFLTARQMRFHLTHDLVELQGQCRIVDAGFDGLVAAAQTLTPYATQFRYPGGRWLHQQRTRTRRLGSRRMSSTSFAEGWGFDDEPAQERRCPAAKRPAVFHRA